MDDKQTVECKKEINNLIWTHGKTNLTLGQARLMSCDILIMIQQSFMANELHDACKETL